MGHREHTQLVAVAVELLPGAQLHDLDPVAELSEHTPQRIEQVPETGRAVDRERKIALPERESLQHSRQAEVVVGVEMGDEHLPEVDEADRGAQQLALRALATVEQEPLAATAQEERAGAAPRRGGAARSSQEHEVQIHAAIVASRDQGSRRPSR